MRRVRAIDSHTDGEPTRVILAGGPVVGRGSESVRAPRLELDASERAACLAIIRTVLSEFDRLGILAQSRRISSILAEARDD